ncbi:DUF2076 domain-containing protein [Methylocella tundrae]|nr:DUF2076 domain-containing protein [Methylocella tundrae]
MSPEERQLLTGLFDRIQSAGANPRDKEAEAFIEDAVKALPYAPYLLTQTTIVQDQALRAANDRLQQLEAQVRDLEQRAAQPQQGGGSFLGGLGSLFGGGNPQPSPPPQQPRAPSPGWGQPPQQGGWQQPPQQQPAGGPWGAPQGGPMGGGFGGGGPMGGPMGGQGGGFLKGALGAAAGVAGGVLLADSIKGLFGGHNNALGIGAGVPGVDQGLAGLGGGRETVVNNYYGDDAVRQQDAQQDADQDQDDIQDAADYSSDYGDDDNSTDV